MKPPKINHILIVLISIFLISDIDTEHECNIASNILIKLVQHTGYIPSL